jgi:hypothetical protein
MFAGRLFNLVQELRGNIRVFCRCRPPTNTERARETDSGGAVCVDFPEDGAVKVENDRGKEKVRASPLAFFPPLQECGVPHFYFYFRYYFSLLISAFAPSSKNEPTYVDVGVRPDV